MFWIITNYFLKNDIRNANEAIYITLFYAFLVSLAAYLTESQEGGETFVQFALFVGLLLAHTLALPGLFQRDVEDGSLDQLRVAPMAFEMIIFSRLLSHWLAISAPLLLITPLLALTAGGDALIWTVAACISSLAMTGIGCLSAALIIGQRERSGLLLLIVLPLNVPVLLFGMLALSSDPAQSADAWACLIGMAAMLLPLSLLACAKLLKFS